MKQFPFDMLIGIVLYLTLHNYNGSNSYAYYFNILIPKTCQDMQNDRMKNPNKYLHQVNDVTKCNHEPHVVKSFGRLSIKKS